MIPDGNLDLQGGTRHGMEVNTFKKNLLSFFFFSLKDICPFKQMRLI